MWLVHTQHKHGCIIQLCMRVYMFKSKDYEDICSVSPITSRYFFHFSFQITSSANWLFTQRARALKNFLTWRDVSATATTALIFNAAGCAVMNFHLSIDLCHIWQAQDVRRTRAWIKDKQSPWWCHITSPVSCFARVVWASARMPSHPHTGGLNCQCI